MGYCVGKEIIQNEWRKRGNQKKFNTTKPIVNPKVRTKEKSCLLLQLAIGHYCIDVFWFLSSPKQTQAHSIHPWWNASGL